MAGPSKVEFPGQKRQRLRMRGTKRAGKNVQQRLRKNLDVLIESPESVLPELRWKGKLAWGRTDPVTKTLKEISKVLDKRHHIHWLNKRMMGKRGDPIAKAWAGALAAAHDDDTVVSGGGGADVDPSGAATANPQQKGMIYLPFWWALRNIKAAAILSISCLLILFFLPAFI